MESSWSLSVPKLYSIYHLVAPPPLPTTPGHFILVSWRWQPSPVLLPGKFHGHRSLVGCSPWGRKESDTTEWLHFHFSLSCIGEGNSDPLQCSCLENPRDGGAWWAAVYGVAQSRTRLKRHSSSSSRVVRRAFFFFFFLSLFLSWLCIKTKIKVEVTEI